MKKVCKELIDFFKNEDGWDKEEIISEISSSVMKKLNCMLGENSISSDEVILFWGDDVSLKCTLHDFEEMFFDEIIKGVCNVIKTA